jgi:hypothetical protein
MLPVVAGGDVVGSGDVVDGELEVDAEAVVEEGAEERVGFEDEHAVRKRPMRTTRHADRDHRTPPSWCPVVIVGRTVPSGCDSP